MVLKCFHLNPGTGGVGAFKGGDGVVREFLFRKPLTLSILTERRVFAPYGLQGTAQHLCHFYLCFCLFWVSLLHMGYKVQPNTSVTFICICFLFVLIVFAPYGLQGTVQHLSCSYLCLFFVCLGVFICFLFVLGVFAPYGLQGTAQHLSHFYLCLFLGCFIVCC